MTAHKILKELEYTGLFRNNRITKFIKGYKRQENVKRHECLYSEGIRDIKEKHYDWVVSLKSVLNNRQKDYKP